MEFKFPDKQEVNNATSSIIGVQHEIQSHLDEAKSKLLTGDPSLACVALDVMERHFVEVKTYAQKALECLNRAQQVGEVISDPMNQLAVLRQRIEQAEAQHRSNLERYTRELTEAKAFVESEKSRLDEEISAHKVRVAERVAELTERYAKELFMAWKQTLARFVFEKIGTEEDVNRAGDALKYALRLSPKTHPVWQALSDLAEPVKESE
jgi:hypothetical protein